MLSKIKQRFRDMGTIKALCIGAEKYANADGQQQPGSEHFVLAALDLPDATARKAFERVGVDAGGFSSAIARQYQEALSNVGIALPAQALVGDSTAAVPNRGGIYHAQPSGQMLMQQLSRRKDGASSIPLVGAHVIIAATAAEYGVTARALRVMGVDPAQLAEAAAAEIKVAQ